MANFMKRATYSVLKIFYLRWKICYPQQLFWENSIPNLLILSNIILLDFLGSDLPYPLPSFPLAFCKIQGNHPNHG